MTATYQSILGWFFFRNNSSWAARIVRVLDSDRNTSSLCWLHGNRVEYLRSEIRKFGSLLKRNSIERNRMWNNVRIGTQNPVDVLPNLDFIKIQCRTNGRRGSKFTKTNFRRDIANSKLWEKKSQHCIKMLSTKPQKYLQITSTSAQGRHFSIGIMADESGNDSNDTGIDAVVKGRSDGWFMSWQ